MIPRRRFLGLLATMPLVRLPGLSDLPQLEPMPIGLGIPKQFDGWSRLLEAHPEFGVERPAWIGFDMPIWRRLRDDIAEAPRLPYLERAGWIWPPVAAPSGKKSGNCGTRSIAVRNFLADRGWPLGAIRPTLCLRDESPDAELSIITPAHAGLSITTTAGDLFLDSIGNIVAPWRVFPYRWHARYASGRAWERLAP